MILGYIGTGVLYGGYIAARVIFGSCPKVELQKNFDLEKYLGTWYEMKRSESITFEEGTCVTAHYSLLESGYVEVLNSQVLDSGLDFQVGEAQASKWHSGQI